MVDSAFITDAEANASLSEHYTWLYELLVQSGLSYFEETATIAGTGVELYDLPADFFGMVAVDYAATTGRFVPLQEYMPQERTFYESDGGSQRPLAYAVIGKQTEAPSTSQKLSLLPSLSSGASVRVRYVPAPIGLEDADGADDDTTVDGVSGWEELIIIKTAIDMLNKEESSTTALERREALLVERIESAAEIRAWSTPRRVVDVDDGNWWERTRDLWTA